MEKVETKAPKGHYIMIEAMNTQTSKMVQVTAEDFELDNGEVFPHVVEFDPHEIPTVEEFQITYDHWRSVIENELKE